MQQEKVRTIRIISILNIRNPQTSIVYESPEESASDDKNQYIQEKRLLVSKSYALKIKTGERVPIHSRIKDYKWYLTKDKYAVLYLMFVANNIHEDTVYRIQGKIQLTIDRFYEDIELQNQTQLNEMRVHLDFAFHQFNASLSSNPHGDFFSDSENSRKEIIDVSGPKPEFDREPSPSDRIDTSNVFYKTDQRKGRVLCIQIVFLLAIFTTIGLGVWDGFAKISSLTN